MVFFIEASVYYIVTAFIEIGIESEVLIDLIVDDITFDKYTTQLTEVK